MKKFFIIILTLLFFSCKKKENSPALLFVYPETNYYNVYTYDILKFDIRGSSETMLTKFSITSKPEAALSTTVFDTSLSAPNLVMSYQYQVPIVQQTTKITLEFILNDDNGNQTRIAKVLTVTVNNKLPAETSGHEMYSPLSGKADAYDIEQGVPVYSGQVSYTQRQILDPVANDSLFSVDTLSRKWISHAGLEFVKFNDFNYANATFNDIKQAYLVGIKKSFVEQLADGDIILTRIPWAHADSGYAAIKIVYVIDNDSTNLDRYIFNIKK